VPRGRLKTLLRPPRVAPVLSASSAVSHQLDRTRGRLCRRSGYADSYAAA
jgi:hypothetical protein